MEINNQEYGHEPTRMLDRKVVLEQSATAMGTVYFVIPYDMTITSVVVYCVSAVLQPTWEFAEDAVTLATDTYDAAGVVETKLAKPGYGVYANTVVTCTLTVANPDDIFIMQLRGILTEGNI